MEYIKFTGDFAELKKMGYKFHKLYARNYMCWMKGTLAIWKKGSDVQMDEFRNFLAVAILRMIEETDGDLPFKTSKATGTKADKWLEGYRYVNLCVDGDQVTTDANLTMEQRRPFIFEATSEKYMKGLCPEHIADLLELYRKGWIEVATR